MKHLKTMLLGAVAVFPTLGAQAAAPVAPTDSLSVAVGTVLGTYIKGNLDSFASLGGLIDTDVFVATMADVLNGRDTGFTAAQANEWIDRYVAATRPADVPDTYTPESQAAFVAEAAKTPGAVVTPTGLVFITLTEGEGPMPGDNDHVQVKYQGRFYDGTLFDATGSPIEFKVSDLTPGFSEGLKLMRPGGKYRLVMPSSLGYGAEGIPGAIPGNAALDFTVELIDILK